MIAGISPILKETSTPQHQPKKPAADMRNRVDGSAIVQNSTELSRYDRNNRTKYYPTSVRMTQHQLLERWRGHSRIGMLGAIQVCPPLSPAARSGAGLAW